MKRIIDRRFQAIYHVLPILVFSMLASPCVAQKGESLASRSSSAEAFYAGVRRGEAIGRIDSVLATIAVATKHVQGLEQVLVPFDPKCFTPIMDEAALSPEVNKDLKREILTAEPVNQTQRRSPEGHFTIYFDTVNRYTASGTPITQDSCSQEFADSVAAIADRAYDFEIVTLAYPKPPFPTADSTFHIHILNLGIDRGPGIYGYTTITDSAVIGYSPSGLEKYRTFNVIDNGFTDAAYCTHTYVAARVTIFHEFQHVIQYGTYGIANDLHDAYFKEMTAVWMETYSNPDVKDYVCDMQAYLPNIQLSLYPGNSSVVSNAAEGYGQAIWLQFLEKKYGYEIVQQIWSRYSNVTYTAEPQEIFAMQDELALRASSFCTEYMRFGSSLYFTGRRFTGESIFPDAQLFPIDLMTVQLTTPGAPTPIQNGAVPASLNFLCAGFGSDTVVAVIARDTNWAIEPSGTITFSNAKGVTFTYQDSIADPFCDSVASGLTASIPVFPQPFVIHSGQTNTVSILASSASKPVNVELDLYTMNFVRVATLTAAAVPFGDAYYEIWNGEDDRGKLVPSGIYLYTINTDGVQRAGKIAVVNAK